MDDQIADECTRPALGHSDNGLPLIDREETKRSSELFVISNTGPPLLERPNVPTPLGVSNFKKPMNRGGIVVCEGPHVITGRPTRLGD
jgi:hypothetical protein